MELKKIGYVTTALTIILGIVFALILAGKIKIDYSNMLLKDTTLLLFSIPAFLIFFSFCLLVNMEHTVLSIADLVMAFIYTGIIILFMIVNAENTKDFTKLLIWSSFFAGALCALNIPFLIRTQSNLHRYFKYFVALLIFITCCLSMTIITNLVKLYSGTTIDYKVLKKKKKNYEIAKYGAYASFIGVLCIPMIGYASSDGLGGGAKNNTPKLVPRNIATDPNMSTNINPNAGINYGNMPVPDGVVANNQVAVSTAPVPTDSTQNTVPGGATQTISSVPEVAGAPQVDISSQSLNAVDQSGATTQNPIAAPIAQPTPVETIPVPTNPVNQAANITANNVAPELQFLLNNNNDKNNNNN